MLTQTNVLWEQNEMGANVLLDDVLSDELFHQANRAFSMTGIGGENPYLSIQDEEKVYVTPLQSEYIAKMWQDDPHLDVEPVGKSSLYVNGRFQNPPQPDGRQTLEYRLKMGNRKRGQTIGSPLTSYFGNTGPMGRY